MQHVLTPAIQRLATAVIGTMRRIERQTSATAVSTHHKTLRLVQIPKIRREIHLLIRRVAFRIASAMLHALDETHLYTTLIRFRVHTHRLSILTAKTRCSTLCIRSIVRNCIPQTRSISRHIVRFRIVRTRIRGARTVLSQRLTQKTVRVHYWDKPVMRLKFRSLKHRSIRRQRGLRHNVVRRVRRRDARTTRRHLRKRTVTPAIRVQKESRNAGESLRDIRLERLPTITISSVHRIHRTTNATR